MIDNKWSWISDLSGVFADMKWAPDEPTNRNGEENCLSIKKNSKSNTIWFNDIQCDQQRRYFCQKSKNPAKNLKTSKACVEVSTQEPILKPLTKELDLQSQLTIKSAIVQNLQKELEMEKSHFRILDGKLQKILTFGYWICKSGLRITELEQKVGENNQELIEKEQLQQQIKKRTIEIEAILRH